MRLSYKKKKSHKWIFKLLLLSICVIAVALGAMNAYFSKQRLLVQARTEIARAFPGWTIDFEAAGIGLGGTLPRLALKLKKIHLMGMVQCRNWDVTAEQLQIHFAWKHLLRGMVQIGPVVFENIKADVQSSVNCQPLAPAPLSAVLPISTRELIEAAKKSANPKEPVVGGKEPSLPDPLFSAITLNEGEITYRGLVLRVKKLATSAYFPDQPLSIRADISLQNAESLRIKPELKLDVVLGRKEGSFHSTGNWREGTVDVSGKWSGEEFTLSGQLVNIPLSEAMSYLGKYRSIPVVVPYQSAWLSCRLDINGKRDLSLIKANFEECAITGEMGEAKAKFIGVEYLANDKIKFSSPFTVGLHQVHVEKVLKSMKIGVLGGVLSDYGLLDASMRVTTDGRFEFVGVIHEIIASFSNQGIAGRQRIPRLEGKLYYDGERVSGQLTKMVLENGNFNGDLSFNFSKNLSQGFLQTGISVLQFDPTIQKLLTKGRMKPLALFARAVVENDFLTRWDGWVGTDLIENEQTTLQKLKAQLSYRDSILSMSIGVQAGTLAKNSQLFAWLEPALRAYDAPGATVRWRQLNAEVTLKERTVVFWRKLKVLSDENRVTLHSQGQWNINGGIEGSLMTEDSKGHALPWSFQGTEKHTVLMPTKAPQPIGK